MKNIVMAVLNPDQRHDLIEKVRRNYALKAMNENNQTSVVQDRLNRICIFEGQGEQKRLVMTVTCVVAPVVFNFEPLLDMTGPNTKFSLNIIMEELDRLKKKCLELINNPSTEHVKRNRIDYLLKAHGLDGL